MTSLNLSEVTEGRAQTPQSGQSFSEPKFHAGISSMGSRSAIHSTATFGLFFLDFYFDRPLNTDDYTKGSIIWVFFCCQHKWLEYPYGKDLMLHCLRSFRGCTLLSILQNRWDCHFIVSSLLLSVARLLFLSSLLVSIHSQTERTYRFLRYFIRRDAKVHVVVVRFRNEMSVASTVKLWRSSVKRTGEPAEFWSDFNGKAKRTCKSCVIMAVIVRNLRPVLFIPPLLVQFLPGLQDTCLAFMNT
jgi:hypothetical protein